MLDALLYIADKALDFVLLGFLVSAACGLPNLLT